MLRIIPLLLALLLTACGAPLAAAPRATLTPAPPPVAAPVVPYPAPPDEAAAEKAASVSYQWVVEDAAHGTGLVTWQGGQLTKCRGMGCALVSVETFGSVAVPGAGPVDIFWRPMEGDRYCAGGVCAVVPAPTVPTPAPVVHDLYLSLVLH